MTILEMLQELNSFIDCKKWLKKAETSELTTENCSELRELTENWSNGLYDEDPDLLRSELISLL